MLQPRPPGKSPLGKLHESNGGELSLLKRLPSQSVVGALVKSIDLAPQETIFDRFSRSRCCSRSESTRETYLMHIMKFLSDRLFTLYRFPDSYRELGAHVRALVALREAERLQRFGRWDPSSTSQLIEECRALMAQSQPTPPVPSVMSSSLIDKLLSKSPFIVVQGKLEQTRAADIRLIDNRTSPLSARDTILLLTLSSSLPHYFRSAEFWFHALSPAAIHEVLNYQSKEPNEFDGRTASRPYLGERLKALKQFMAFLHEERICSLDTHQIGPISPRPQRPQRVLSLAELKRVVRYLDTTAQRAQTPRERFIACRNRALISLFINTASRSRALLYVRHRDLRRDPSSRKGAFTIDLTDKGGKVRRFHLNGLVSDIVHEYLKAMRSHLARNPSPDDYVFRSSQGKNFGKRSLRELVLKIGKEAGVQHIGPHALRRTVGHLLALRGHSTLSIAQTLDHSLIYTTQRYLPAPGKDPRSAKLISQLLKAPLSRSIKKPLVVQPCSGAVSEILARARVRISSRTSPHDTRRARRHAFWIKDLPDSSSSKIIDRVLPLPNPTQPSVLTRFFHSSRFRSDSNALLNTTAVARVLVSVFKSLPAENHPLLTVFHRLHRILRVSAFSPIAADRHPDLVKKLTVPTDIKNSLVNRATWSIALASLSLILQNEQAHKLDDIRPASRSPLGRWIGAREAFILDTVLNAGRDFLNDTFWTTILAPQIVEASLQASQSRDSLDCRTIRVRRVAIGTFARYLRDDEHMLVTAPMFPHPTRSSKPRDDTSRIVTLRDLTKIIERAEQRVIDCHKRDKVRRLSHELMIKLMICTAARIGEVRNLRLQDFESFDGGRSLSVRLYTKGQYQITREIPAQIVPLLLTYLSMSGYTEPNRPLFANRRGGALTSQQILTILRTISAEAGVTCLNGRSANVTGSVIRATLASEAAQRGADVRHIAELLRHKSLLTCEHYVKRIQGQNRLRMIGDLLQLTKQRP